MQLARFERPVLVGHPLGNVPIMDRTELLARLRDATTPNETATAIYDAPRWLVDHPDDQAVRSAMADLMGLEHQSLWQASGTRTRKSRFAASLPIRKARAQGGCVWMTS